MDVTVIFMMAIIAVPSLVILKFGSWLISKIFHKPLVDNTGRIVWATLISLVIQVAVVIIVTAAQLVSGKYHGYQICTIDTCSWTSFWSVVSTRIGGIWFINVLSLTAPTIVLTLVAYGVLTLISIIRGRTQPVNVAQ